MLDAVKWLVTVTVTICWQLVVNRKAANSFTYPRTIEPPSYSIAEAANIIASSFGVPLNPFENITYITRDHLLPGLEDFYTNGSDSSNSSFNSTYQTDSNSEHASGWVITSRAFFDLFLSLVGVGLGYWIVRRRSASSRSRKTAQLANADNFDCATALIASSHLAWVPPEYDTGSIEYEMLKAQLKTTTAAFATVHSLCTDYQNWVSWYQVEQNILQGKVSRETEEHFATRESLTQQLNAEKAYRAVVEQELKGEIMILNKDNAGLKKLKISAAQVEAESLQLEKRTKEFDVRARRVMNRESMCNIDQEHIAGLRDENAELKGDKHVREKTLRASENTIKTLRKHLEEAQKRVGSAEGLRRDEIATLQQLHRKHNNEAEQRYSDKLAEEKKSLNARINKLAHQNQLQNTRINTLTDQKRSQNTRINELEAKLEAAGNENEKIGQLLRESEMLAATKEAKVADLTQEAMLSKTEYDRLAVEYKYLTEKATSFESELEAARNEKERLGQQLREGEMLAATREAGVADLSQEALLAKTEYDKLVVEYKHLTEKATSFESELRATRNEHERFGQLLLEAETCVGTKEAEIADLTQEAILGKAEYEHLALEHKHLTGAVTSLESELNMAKQQIESLKAEKEAAAGNQKSHISGNAEATEDGSTVVPNAAFPWPSDVHSIGGDILEPSNNPWMQESSNYEANTTSMPLQGSETLIDEQLLEQLLFDEHPSDHDMSTAPSDATLAFPNTTSMPSQGSAALFDGNLFDGNLFDESLFDESLFGESLFGEHQFDHDMSTAPSDATLAFPNTTSMPSQDCEAMSNEHPSDHDMSTAPSDATLTVSNTTSMPSQDSAALFDEHPSDHDMSTAPSDATLTFPDTTSMPPQDSTAPSDHDMSTAPSDAIFTFPNTTSMPSQDSTAPSNHDVSTAPSDATLAFPNTATSFVAGGLGTPLPKDSTAQESNQAPSTSTDTDVAMSTAANTTDDTKLWLEITPIEDQRQIANAAVLHRRVLLQPSIRKSNQGKAAASQTSQAPAAKDSDAPPPPPPAPSLPESVTFTPNKDTRGKASEGFMWCNECGYHKKLTDSGICDVCDWQAEQARRKAAKAAAKTSTGKKS